MSAPSKYVNKTRPESQLSADQFLGPGHEDLVVVHTQWWAKVLIVAGVPFLAIAGVGTIWNCIAAGFTPLVQSLVLSAAGLFCMLAVLKGMPLLRFLRHTLTLHADGIEIAKGPLSTYLHWHQIGAIKTSATFQVLRIYNQGGQLVYAVDYYAVNFRYFAALLEEVLYPDVERDEGG